MLNKIKLRLFDDSSQTMLYQDDYNFILCDDKVIPYHKSVDISLINNLNPIIVDYGKIHVMEYSGYNTLGEEELYENDIVEFGTPFKIKGIIKIEDGRWVVKTHDCLIDINLIYDKCNKIGNLFQTTYIY